MSWSAPDDANRSELSYVLPLRWQHGGVCRDELTAYLRRVVRWCEDVIVVDGSPPDVFAANALELARLVHDAISRPPRHASLDRERSPGVLTGVGRPATSAS